MNRVAALELYHFLKDLSPEEVLEKMRSKVRAEMEEEERRDEIADLRRRVEKLEREARLDKARATVDSITSKIAEKAEEEGSG